MSFRMFPHPKRWRQATWYSLLVASSSANLAQGQSGSLFREEEAGKSSPVPGEPLPAPGPLRGPVNPFVPPLPGWDPNNPLQAASWTAVPQVPSRTLKIHDIVSIRVDKIATSSAVGNVQSRKNALYDARLNDWIDLTALDTIKPAKQSDGDPRVQGQENEVYRAQSNLQTREQLSFNIAAEIADIRPNGTLVLSARETYTLNDNLWETSLSGVCRPEDVGPDNVILSRNIIELKVAKQELGHVRDGYSRGWFTRLLARFKPF